jgi:hypothetical protein
MTAIEMRNKAKFTKNIKNVLNQAKPIDFIQGENWYKNARLFSFKTSRKYNVSFRKVCAMLAALSPRNKWARNKTDCIDLISYLTGNTNNFPKCATYGKMVDKAVRIFHSSDDSCENMLKLLNGPKIKAFFLNIYDSNSQNVTVDSWIQLISLGKYISVDERPSLKISDYKLIESIIKDIAAKRKINPPIIQAVLWVSFKRLTAQDDYN